MIRQDSSGLVARRHLDVQAAEPDTVRRLLTSPRAAWLWFPIRIYLGYQWLSSGQEKLRSAGWMQTGAGLKGFWQHAVNSPVGGMREVVHYGWYHAFLQFMLMHHWYVWFARLVAIGETSIGVLLLLGAFTGLAAAAGAFLNFNYMLAGSASANPVLFSVAILLLLAWRVAGRVGLDYAFLRAHRRRSPATGLSGRASLQTDGTR